MKNEQSNNLTIGEKTYDSDSLTEFGLTIINDLQRIDSLIETQKLAVSASTIARNVIFEKLKKEVANFTEIEKTVIPANDL